MRPIRLVFEAHMEFSLGFEFMRASFLERYIWCSFRLSVSRPG